MRLYADADFWLALIKQKDRYKEAAVRWLKQNKERNEIVTSTLACLEVWFYLYSVRSRHIAMDAVRSIAALCAEIVSYDFSDMEAALVLAGHHELSPADSIHTELARGCDGIVSSDESLDRTGLKRIDFTKG